MEKKKDSSYFISLKVDYAFTQVMKNKKVLQGFLSAVFKVPEINILDIEVLDRYLMREYKKDKYGILDVRVNIKNIGHIDLEMQIGEDLKWANRSIFYTSKLYIEDLKGGDSYIDCGKIINISILDFDLCKDTDYFYSCFHIREDQRNTIYSDKLEYHIIELGKLKNQPPVESDRKLYQWAMLIHAECEEERAMIEKDPYIIEAMEELERLSHDPSRKAEYDWREKCLRDYNHYYYALPHLQGKEIGLKEGINIGEERLIKLIQSLSEEGKEGLINNVLTNKNIRDSLYQEYQLV